jgi:hypothetical protein
MSADFGLSGRILKVNLFALTNDIQLRTVGLMLRCARLSLPNGRPIMTTAARISYAVLALTLVLAGVLHLGAALLALLFSYFALRKLFSFTKTKWLALILFVLLAASIAYAAGHFTRAAVTALPEVADHSIPSASAWAEARQINCPSPISTVSGHCWSTRLKKKRTICSVARLPEARPQPCSSFSSGLSPP